MPGDNSSSAIESRASENSTTLCSPIDFLAEGRAPPVPIAISEISRDTVILTREQYQKTIPAERPSHFAPLGRRPADKTTEKESSPTYGYHPRSLTNIAVLGENAEDTWRSLQVLSKSFLSREVNRQPGSVLILRWEWFEPRVRGLDITSLNLNSTYMRILVPPSMIDHAREVLYHGAGETRVLPLLFDPDLVPKQWQIESRLHQFLAVDMRFAQLSDVTPGSVTLVDLTGLSMGDAWQVAEHVIRTFKATQAEDGDVDRLVVLPELQQLLNHPSRPPKYWDTGVACQVAEDVIRTIKESDADYKLVVLSQLEPILNNPSRPQHLWESCMTITPYQYLFKPGKHCKNLDEHFDLDDFFQMDDRQRLTNYLYRCMHALVAAAALAGRDSPLRAHNL